MTLQEFFESTGGRVTIAVIVVVLLILAAVAGRPKAKGEEKTADSHRFDTRAMVISALLIAMSFVLAQIRLFKMPQGGSVTAFSMLPIALCAYLFGTKRGVMAGASLGLINLMFDPYVIHPAQLLIDYIFAFAALGIGGVFRNQTNGLIKGYLLGIFGRYVCAVASGVIFFGAYAPKNFNAWTWSLWYNLTYIAAEGIITVIVLCIPAVKKMFENARRKVDA
jgi:thiamine transporter